MPHRRRLVLVVLVLVPVLVVLVLVLVVLVLVPVLVPVLVVLVLVLVVLVLVLLVATMHRLARSCATSAWILCARVTSPCISYDAHANQSSTVYVLRGAVLWLWLGLTCSNAMLWPENVR